MPLIFLSSPNSLTSNSFTHISPHPPIYASFCAPYIDAYMSVGSMYTLSYLLSIDLKLKGIHEPDKTEAIREMLSELLSKYIFAIELSHQKMEYALKDLSFHDLEDSYQYYCAIENNCDANVTINIKHFKGDHKKQIPIYTPKEFVERFIKQEETTNQ